MAITYTAWSGGDTSTGTGTVVGSGGQMGDVAVILASVDGVDGIHAPRDWSRVFYKQDTAGGVSVAAYLKKLTGPLASRYVFQNRNAAGETFNWVLLLFQEVDVANPVDCPSKKRRVSEPDGTNDVTISGVTTVSDGAVGVYAAAVNAEPITLPTSSTGLTVSVGTAIGAVSGFSNTLVVGTKTFAAAGATGDQTTTLDVSIVSAAVGLFALRLVDSYPPA